MGLHQTIKFLYIKENNQQRDSLQWLTRVILATQEAEIWRIMVRSQPRQIVHKTLFQKTLHEKGLVEWLKF
jgi:hypothetical protein